MRRIDPKQLETRRDYEKEKIEKYREDPVYEAIELLADELKGKKVNITNTRFPDAARTVVIEKITTNYVPGTSLKNKYINIIENGVEIMKFDIPTDIRVKGNRFTLDYSERNEDRVIMRSFKLKDTETLEVYLEVVSE